MSLVRTLGLSSLLLFGCLAPAADAPPPAGDKAFGSGIHCTDAHGTGYEGGTNPWGYRCTKTGRWSRRPCFSAPYDYPEMHVLTGGYSICVNGAWVHRPETPFRPLGGWVVHVCTDSYGAKYELEELNRWGYVCSVGGAWELAPCEHLGDPYPSMHVREDEWICANGRWEHLSSTAPISD